MARLVAACALGVVIGVVAGAARQSHGQQLDGALECQQPVPDQPPVCGDPRVLFEAAALHEQVPELGVADLVGASNSTGLGPVTYAIAVGELIPPSPPAAPVRSQPAPASAVVAGGGASTAPGWPIGGALGARIYCVEGMESTHGRYMYNPTPWVGEHAQGWLGFLPSTARRWGAVIGNRASEWQAAARMIAAGQGRQFAGIAAGRC